MGYQFTWPVNLSRWARRRIKPATRRLMLCNRQRIYIAR